MKSCHTLPFHFLERFQADIDLLLGRDREAQQRSSALFLLKLKEFRRLPQSAIDDVIHGWNGLFHHTVDLLNARVRERLAINVSSIGLEEVFTDFPSPFEGLETQYLQFREKLGLVGVFLIEGYCLHREALYLADLCISNYT